MEQLPFTDDGLPDLLTCQEAADVLRVEVDTVRRYIKQGRLKATRIGKPYRIQRDDLKAFYDSLVDPTAG